MKECRSKDEGCRSGPSSASCTRAHGCGSRFGAEARAGAVIWADAGRSDVTAKRAELADLIAVPDPAELARRSDVIVSICPPHAARAVAEEVAGRGRRRRCAPGVRGGQRGRPEHRDRHRGAPRARHGGRRVGDRAARLEAGHHGAVARRRAGAGDRGPVRRHPVRRPGARTAARRRERAEGVLRGAEQGDPGGVVRADGRRARLRRRGGAAGGARPRGRGAPVGRDRAASGTGRVALGGGDGRGGGRVRRRRAARRVLRGRGAGVPPDRRRRSRRAPRRVGHPRP